MAKEKEADKKLKYGKIIQTIFSGLYGAFVAYFGISLSDSITKKFNAVVIFLSIMVVALMFIISFMFQMIIHESGHMIFGMLTGYKFISFRIGELTFVKDKDRIVIKKYKVVGTGGQCLMMPPEGDGYNCPYILYNLGGIIANAVISFVFFLIYIAVPVPKILAIFIISISICGVFCVLINGIPMRIGVVTNDGYNTITIGKDKIARYCFYMLLKINGLIYKGVRIKDMPSEWFQLPEEADLGNSMVCSIKAAEGSYYHDKKEFPKAQKCYTGLLNGNNGLSELSKNEIRCELLFYEIIGEASSEIIDELYTDKLKKYISATSIYITRKRLMYAYNLIVLKDRDKADKILLEAGEAAKTHPAKAEAESEMEIIEFVKDKFGQH